MSGDRDGLIRAAFQQHALEVVELQEASGVVVGDDLRIAVSDALTWAAKLHDQSGPGPNKVANVTPVVDDPDHVLWGATWARHRAAHGDTHLLEVRTNPADWAPRVKWSGWLPWSPKAITYFQRIDIEVPGDKSRHLQPFYNACVAGLYVLDVCDMLLANRA